MAPSPFEPSSTGSSQQASGTSDSSFESILAEEAGVLHQDGFHGAIPAEHQAYPVSNYFAPTYLGSHFPLVGAQYLFPSHPRFMFMTGYPQWPVGYVDLSLPFFPILPHQGVQPYGFPPTYTNYASPSYHSMQYHDMQTAATSQSGTGSFGACESSSMISIQRESETHNTSEGHTVGLWASTSAPDISDAAKEASLSLLIMGASGNHGGSKPIHEPLAADPFGNALLGQNSPEARETDTFSDDGKMPSHSGGFVPHELDEGGLPSPSAACSLTTGLPGPVSSVQGPVSKSAVSMQEGKDRPQMDDGEACPSLDEISISSTDCPPVSHPSRSTTITTSRKKYSSISSGKRPVDSSNAECPSSLTASSETRTPKVQRRRKKRASQAANVTKQVAKDPMLELRSITAISAASKSPLNLSWSQRKGAWTDLTTGQEYSSSILLEDYQLLSVSGRLSGTFDIELFPKGDSWEGVDSLNTWNIRTRGTFIIGALRAPRPCATIICESELVEG